MNLNRVLKATAASVGELPSLEQAALIAATSPALQVGSAEATLPRSARPPPSVEELHSASPPLWAEAAHLEIARSRVHPALRSGMLPAGGGSVRWRREVAAGSVRWRREAGLAVAASLQTQPSAISVVAEYRERGRLSGPFNSSPSS